MTSNTTKLSRRGMLQGCAGSFAAMACGAPFVPQTALASIGDPLIASERLPNFDQDDLLDRAYGLLLGSFIGDALGGPTEFQPINRAAKLAGGPHLWIEGEILDKDARLAAANRVRLIPYGVLRPDSEPYGQWSANAPAGTITDDSRQKLILLDAMRSARKSGVELTDKIFAQAYLDWPNKELFQEHPHYEKLNEVWLAEYRLAAHWLLGERDLQRAAPPERLWGGFPTCAGQMALLPMAARYSGNAEKAYLAAYRIDFIDVGWGRDLNCGIVAGLSAAMTMKVDETEPSKTWDAIREVMLKCDPYGYNQIPWTERASSRWLRLAQQVVKEAEQQPAKLFAALTKTFSETTKWHAEVPFVVMWACLELADYDPLAAWQLSIEWGEDTDSFAQLLGAFLGALYGAKFFPNTMSRLVEERVKADYDEDLQSMAEFLTDRET